MISKYKSTPERPAPTASKQVGDDALVFRNPKNPDPLDLSSLMEPTPGWSAEKASLKSKTSWHSGKNYSSWKPKNEIYSKTASVKKATPDSKNSSTSAPKTRGFTAKLAKEMPTKGVTLKPILNRQSGGDNLRVMVLGGLEEVGRNMTLIECNQEIIIIDMGLQFPEEDMLGIDYIIPNVSYLKDKKSWIKGVVISHGHYDHIGGIPHIMGEIGNPPMFMGKLTAGLVRKRHLEYKTAPTLKIKEIDGTTKIKLGQNFNLEFMRVNHSIPDCFATIINTPLGTVFHTGDFKIDFTPVNDEPADLNKMAQVGARGVLLLMSDSTDATHPGHQVSESHIGEEMGQLFEKINGRIIIATFASQLARIQKIFDLAAEHGRRVSLQGRSMNSNVEVAREIGYLKFSPKLLIDDKELNKLPDNKIIIVGTGAQGESNAFLSRVVSGEHRVVSLKQGDTVLFSSSAIPGNERSIQNLMDRVSRQGAKIIHYRMLDIHAGGHAKAEDLKLTMRLLKPRYFMPIEANHYMLETHAELAREVGIPNDRIFVADNGQVIDFRRRGSEVVGTLTKEKVPSDYVMVDGLGVGDVSEVVLRDRRMMAEDGMIVVIATIDSHTGDVIGNPDLISRGFVHMKENRELIEKTRQRVKKIIKDKDASLSDETLKGKLRNDIGKFLFSQTKRRPMVLPVIIKV
ncbi:MAG: ribonuclease J [Patescibacteria group bacterium]|jgi:ribonuclease J